MTESEKNKFYVTTPIYYVTARPHLGSLYSTVLADVAARWNKLLGKKTHFTTGTDEFGQKVAEAAEKAGKKPQEFVDSFIDAFKRTWRDYHIDYDTFIRTTDSYHVKAVQHWLQQLIDKGDIYKSFYEGWYCTPCETFLTDKEAEEIPAGSDVPLCPSCSRPTKKVAEESYFFKLSKYQDKLLAFYKEHPDFIAPKERLHEVINFVKGGLKDLSISRTTLSWGVPFPGDEKHVAYVWADALNNYVTAVGYGQKNKEKEFNFWWPADLHILGKDIVRFHAIYWPAFLMASDLPLPHKLLVHGWIKVGDKKMSKSLGNVVDPQELYKEYGADPVRYYLVRQLSIAQDASFTIDDLEQRISSDLANDLGNLLNRMVLLADKNGLYEVHAPATWSEKSLELRDHFWDVLDDVTELMESCSYHMAFAELWKFINQVNAYFHAAEPWKVVKKDKQAFQEIISATCHSLYCIALVLWPVMPEKMEQLLKSLGSSLQLGDDIIDALKTEGWQHTFMLHKMPPLFKKPEPKKEEKIVEEEKNNYIAIDDVVKVELLVGTITSVDEVPKSDKLYKMLVDFGDQGERQVLAGVRKFFAPEDLVGKQATFVGNLKPRTMLGLESQGMMLVAKDADGGVQIMSPGKPVPNGTRLS